MGSYGKNTQVTTKKCKYPAVFSLRCKLTVADYLYDSVWATLNGLCRGQAVLDTPVSVFAAQHFKSINNWVQTVRSMNTGEIVRVCDLISQLRTRSPTLGDLCQRAVELQVENSRM